MAVVLPVFKGERLVVAEFMIQAADSVDSVWVKVAQEFIWYLLKVRAIPFAVLLGLAFTKMRKMTASLFAIWTGISGGILLSIAVTELGIRGSIFCLLGIFPQFLFYIPSFLIVLSYCWMYPKSRWSREKTIMSVGMLLSGMIMETYVNPFLLHAFLKKF